MAVSSQTPRTRALKAAKNKKPKVIFKSLEDFKLHNIDVNYELLEIEPFEDIDSFLLRVINKRFNSKIVKQFFETENANNVFCVVLDIEHKKILFRFHMVDSDIVFNREVASDVSEVNIQIGILNSQEKFILVENYLDTVLKNYQKGLLNEKRVISLVKEKLFRDYEIIYNDILDNAGVDFALVCKKTAQLFPFQIKSSWRSVKEAERKGKIIYKFDKLEIPIIFIVVSRNITDQSILNIIRSKIQKNNIIYN